LAQRAYKDRLADRLRNVRLSVEQRCDFERRTKYLTLYYHLPLSLNERRRVLAEIDWIDRRLGRSKIAERGAADIGCSKRQIERDVREGRRLYADLLRTVANIAVTNEDIETGTVFDILAELPRDLQIAVADEAERRRVYEEVTGEAAQQKRTKKLNHGILNHLDVAQRNTRETRERLAPLTLSDQAAEVARLRIERLKAERLADEQASRRQAAFDQTLTGGDAELARLFHALPRADRVAFVREHVAPFIDEEVLL
jgi:hypothetical protein